MIRPKNETEALVLSITKNYKMNIKQTHTKPQETLEFKLNKPSETFSFKPPIILGLDPNWLIGLVSLDVYKFKFCVTHERNKFER